MGEHVDSESEDQMILEEHYTQTMKIDLKKARFPCCIVWTPLPVISWLIPFIGHMGICREDGVIMDFAGPNFVSVDNFAFGAVARYIQIDKDKECYLFPRSSSFASGDEYNLEAPPTDKLAWDDAVKKSTQEYQHHLYSLFTCNCHSFVANSVNRLGFLSGGWNVVNLAALMFLKGQWVSTGAMIRSYLPFTIVFCSGVLFWGAAFLTFLAFFASLLVGWFLVGTYLVKDVIQL